ncbi:zinc finger domain-containing protein [Leucobacter sp. W1153]|uniref:zinc finger domain-containing protein n=1 Tax=Leucobacter sp. W1153 TaxID=3439064 RepID=UPI003F37CF75
MGPTRTWVHIRLPAQTRVLRRGLFHCVHSLGLTGAPRPRCGTPIRKITLAGRSSHFCPRRQRRR